MNFSFVIIGVARILGRYYAIPASGRMQNDYQCSVPSTTLTVRKRAPDCSSEAARLRLVPGRPPYRTECGPVHERSKE